MDIGKIKPLLVFDLNRPKVNRTPKTIDTFDSFCHNSRVGAESAFHIDLHFCSQGHYNCIQKLGSNFMNTICIVKGVRVSV